MNHNNYDNTTNGKSKINLNKSKGINLKKSEPIKKTNEPYQSSSQNTYTNNYSNNNSNYYSNDYYPNSSPLDSIDWFNAIFYFIGGMILVFPLLTLVTIAVPGVMLVLFGILFLWIWIIAGFKSAMWLLGGFILILILGGISLAFYQSLFN